MFERIKELRKRSTQSDGMTILEAVIAMVGSMALIGGAFFGTVVIFEAQDAGRAQYNNTADVIAAKTSLLRDFKNAKSARINGTGSQRIDLRMNNNTCTSWKIENGVLFSNRQGAPVSESGWQTVTDRVNNGTFAVTTAGPSFNILMDNGKTWNEIVKYKNASSNGGSCW